MEIVSKLWPTGAMIQTCLLDLGSAILPRVLGSFCFLDIRQSIITFTVPTIFDVVFIRLLYSAKLA